MFQKSIATSLILLSVSITNAETLLTRNATDYQFGDRVLMVITTNPKLPNQPIYMWREHVKFNGTPGALSYNAKYIGTTDSRGVFIQDFKPIPTSKILCGKFKNEYVTVGSLSAEKSNKVNYIIRDREWVGPILCTDYR